VRAPVVASWLARQGHAAAVLEGGVAALSDIATERVAPHVTLPDFAFIGPHALDSLRRAGQLEVLDLRPSALYRSGHIPGATWAIRPRIAKAVGTGVHVLVAEAPGI